MVLLSINSFMKISTKIILPFILLLSVLVGTFFYLLLYLNSVQGIIEKELQTTQKVNSLSTRIMQLRQQTQLSVLSYRFNKDKKYLDLINYNQGEVSRLLSEIKPYVKTQTGRELLEKFIKSRNSLRGIRNDLIQAVQSDNEQLTKQTFTAWEIQDENAFAALYDFTNYNLQSIEQNELLYKELVVRIFWIAVGLTLLTIVLIVALYFYLQRIITKPIEELSVAAHKISNGNFNTKLSVSTADELGDLANSLDDMSGKLKKYYRNLQEEVREKEKEIQRNKAFERQKDEFMSIASHELKTPVTSLKVFNQLMKNITEKKGDSEYAPYLNKMDKQLTRLAGLVATLLDVNRIQTGKMPFDKKFFDINQTIEDIVEVSQKTADKHTIILHGKVNQKVYGDEDRISQVLNNLIANAIKYSPDGGEVLITIINQKTTFTIQVKDYGIGIDKVHQEKIFDRFYRVAGKEETTYPGLGIGLYLSAAIIKRHDGKLEVESEKGKGSTFHLTLPYHGN